jgi:hypothetical protein
VSIVGATSSAYTAVAADVASTLRAAVTATNSAGSASATSNQTAAVAAQASAPVNTGLPVVSGTARVASQLTVSAGSWSGSPAPTFGYQWLRCDSGGLSCVSIVGATSSAYTAVAADVASTLRASVTATNSAGSAVATSSQTAAVAAASGGSFPTTSIVDNFNRTGPAAGSSWSTMFSGESLFSLSNSQAIAAAGTYAAGAWNASTFGPNVEAYATMNSDVGLNLFARVTNPGTTGISGYTIEFHPNLSAVYVYRITGGGYSGILGGAISTTFARGARVGMQVTGNTISAWIDTGSGWKLVGSRTDSTYSQAGYIGAELYGGTNRNLDDFGGGTAP